MIQDAWKNFELSGKVLDYLAYRQKTEQNTGYESEGKAVFLERGMESYGAERGSDGNGVKGNADWGV